MYKQIKPFFNLNNISVLKVIIYLTTIVLTIIISYYISLKNYLLFHIFAELFAIVISSALFMIVWNTKDKNENPNLVYLGIAYLFIGILDLFHTISYKGMNIYTDYSFYANQLWIAARYMESISLLLFTTIISNKKKISYHFVFVIFLIISILVYISIFVLKIFPICFIDGYGQTSFKIVSEYIVICILIINVILVSLNKKNYISKIFIYMVASIILTIISEFMFTLYLSNYGLSNITGHIFKLFSFYFIYKALIETSLKRPYDLIYTKLKESEQRLSDLNDSKDKFFSIIAHDLKNPFSGVMGFIDIIFKHYKDLSEKELIEYLNLIKNTTKNSIEFLNNLLIWARTQTGRIKFEPIEIDLKNLINDVIEFVQVSADRKFININNNIQENTCIYADINMMDTIFRNLLTNAIKFTGENGIITITSELTVDEHIRISVEDTGIGISEENIKKLFKLDTMISTKGTNEETGSGIGLIICKEFVDKHSGKIEVSGKINAGSKFSVVIPNKPIKKTKG